MLDLVRSGWFSHRFLVVDGSASVGELRVSQLLREAAVLGAVLFSDGFFLRDMPARAVAELPDEMPLETRLFIAWLALHKRRQMVG
jgi:hypothetical protein